MAILQRWTIFSYWHINDIPDANNNSTIFNFKQKITCKTGDDCTKDLKIMVPVKHLCNFWINFEMPLINFEVNLILTSSANSLLSNYGYQETIFAITIRDTKLYVVVVSLSTQDKAKLFQQLKSGFKRAINWNKFQSKITI